MAELLSVARSLSSYEHNALRAHMPETNVALPPHASVRWRRVGEVALTLLERGEYQRALQKSGSGLADMDVHEVSAIVSEALKPRPMEAGMQRTSVYKTDFLGSGKFLDIAYFLESPAILEQRQSIIECLDQINGVNSGWRDFLPHVSIATIDTICADETILEVFDKIRPSELHFLPAKPKIS